MRDGAHHDPRSPTRINAALRFFLGGSCASSRGCDCVAADDMSPDELLSRASLAVRTPSTFSSTLAAGVSGGSALRFAGISGGGTVVRGEMAGSPTACVEGVAMGVATVELVSGRA